MYTIVFRRLGGLEENSPCSFFSEFISVSLRHGPAGLAKDLDKLADAAMPRESAWERRWTNDDEVK